MDLSKISDDELIARAKAFGTPTYLELVSRLEEHHRLQIEAEDRGTQLCILVDSLRRQVTQLVSYITSAMSQKLARDTRRVLLDAINYHSDVEEYRIIGSLDPWPYNGQPCVCGRNEVCDGNHKEERHGNDV